MIAAADLIARRASVCGALPGGYVSALVGMLSFRGSLLFTAFLDGTRLDASGHQAFGLAAVLFSADALPAFELEWVTRLSMAQRPFHATACHAGRGAFHGVSRPEREILLHDLAAIIAKHRGPGFIGSVKLAAYEAYRRESPREARHIGSPYSVCALGILDRCRGYLDECGEQDDGVHYIVEMGDLGLVDAMNRLLALSLNEHARRSFRLASFAAHPKGAFAGLEAADLVAWAWRRSYSDAIRNGGDGLSPWHPVFKALFGPSSPPIMLASYNGPISLGIRAMVNAFYRLDPPLM